MKHVDRTDCAIADVAAIRDHLAGNGSERVQDIIDSIILSTDGLVRHPGLGSPVGYRRWRKWRAARTNDLVFCESRQTRLVVIRVLHARSDWQAIAG